MTVHQQLSETELGIVLPDCVLVAVDLSRTSLRAADYAVGLARRNGVGVVGVYVRHCNGLMLSSPGAAVYAKATEGELADEAGEYISGNASRLGTTSAFTVLDGSPCTAIRRLARDLKASAIVVGASERHVHRWFGSLAARLARKAPCPVIIVP